MKTIAVVGASLAGLRAAEALRSKGFDGSLVLVGAETELPYDRPPLSKEILRGEWEPDRLALRRDGLDDLDLTLELGRRAEALDPAAKKLTLDDGRTLAYDGLVIATGSEVRTLPGTEGMAGVHTLRTIADALALRAEFERSPRVAVVGAGFIGAEVASSARMIGLDVTVIEGLETPLEPIVGKETGAHVAALHRDNGTTLRLGVTVAALEGAGRVERVRLSDGSAVDADVVVVGIGVRPATQWLEGSGIELGNGVICDAKCATNAPDVVAAGDLASFVNERFGERMRLEHWTNAAEQAEAAAERLLAGPEGARPYAPVPYFWSDIYKTKIQLAGRPRPDDEVRIVSGSPEEKRFVTLFGRDDKLSAVFAMRRPRHVMEYQTLIEQGVSFSDALAHAGV